ncbi:hypothetical protein [Pelagibius marinus]|uniref:hypothetical protein n=1 Tax=Pelagibius marinus TaxID=2762760 RepID=UPI001872F503|nr:hypothetical protein [Pelagibius marinus]
MTKAPASVIQGLTRPLILAGFLVAGEVALITGAAEFFRAMNGDIPADLLSGLLPAPDDPTLRAEALHARLAWIVSVVLAIFASIGATLLAVTKIMKEAEPLRRGLLIAVAALAFVTAIVAASSDVSREVLQRPVLEPTLGSWSVGGIAVATTFTTIRQVVNALFSAATVALVLALAARAALGPTQELQQGRELNAAERKADLRELLLGAAAVLVSIVITMAAWLTWPKAGLADNSAAFVTLDHIAQGIGLYWGGVFSLCLVLAYLPCVAYLKDLEGKGAAAGEAAGDGGRQVKLLQDVAALVSPFVSALVPVFLI